VNHEMVWTVNFHDKQRRDWELLAKQSERDEEPGHAAYAWAQEDMWAKFANNANNAFVKYRVTE
jgi:hypothetical protein